MNRTLKLVISMSLMYSASLSFGETGGYTIPDPIQSPPPLDNSQTDFQSQAQQNTQAAQMGAQQMNAQQSGLVQGGLNQAFAAQGPQTQLQSDTQSIDRRQNFNQSGNLSNSGAGAAGTAGGVLTGLGVPMLLSPDLPTQIAGAMLLADAAQEFAQMGASNNAGNQNNGIANQLSQPNGNGTAATGTSTPASASNYIDQKTKDALNQAGINPDDFAQKLSNGNLSSNDLLSQYAGNPTVTPEAQQAADSMVNNTLATIPQPDPSKALILDDSNPVQTVGAGGSLMRSPASGLSGAPPASTVAEGSGNLASSGHTIGAKGNEAAANPVAAELGLTGLSDSAIRGWVSSAAPTQVADFGPRAFLSSGLAQVGVAVRPKGESIFQVAHHQFRSFGRWRKQDRVAQN